MSFLHDECSFELFTRKKADVSQPFRCGDDDLDEFFRRTWIFPWHTPSDRHNNT